MYNLNEIVLFYTSVSRSLYRNSSYFQKIYFYKRILIFFQMIQKQARTTSILSAMQKSVNMDKITLCLDVIPFLLDILNPRLRSVSAQLYTLEEKAELTNLINIMLDFGLVFVQEKKLEGGYEYNIDP